MIAEKPILVFYWKNYARNSPESERMLLLSLVEKFNGNTIISQILRMFRILINQLKKFWDLGNFLLQFINY